MEFVVIGGVAFFVSGLTLFSGFGLGTLLMPAFALFFPVEVAVAATAIVHFANNILKVSVFARRADWGVVMRFATPAVAAAFGGAAVLGLVSGVEPIATYEIAGRHAVVTPIKLVMGVLMVAFALFELVPRLQRLEFDRRYLPLGGVLSGFFGGLSGHQGALRSAFLSKVGLAPEVFVAVNSVTGFTVDLTRLAVYGAMTLTGPLATVRDNWALVAVATAAAFAGVLVGKRFIKKVTMRLIQAVTGALLMTIGIALGVGFI